MVGINTEGVRDSLRGRKGGGLPPLQMNFQEQRLKDEDIWPEVSSPRVRVTVPWEYAIKVGHVKLNEFILDPKAVGSH